MTKRPELTKALNSDTFIKYYYLKEELVTFCRENKLASSGSKIELTKRIEEFLRTGIQTTTPQKTYKKSTIPLELTPQISIEENFVCSEIHRAFFKSIIGNSFKFNVQFQKYLKNAAGEKYSDAIHKYYAIQEDKKKNKGKSKIDKQFEYNTYIRDFYNHNKGANLDTAIACWKYKKNLPGHNKYEKADLLKIKSD